MNKVKRLIEIKRQIGLADTKIFRAGKRRQGLIDERTRIVASLTLDEKRLFKDKIERACK